MIANMYMIPEYHRKKCTYRLTSWGNSSICEVIFSILLLAMCLEQECDKLLWNSKWHYMYFKIKVYWNNIEKVNKSFFKI